LGKFRAKPSQTGDHTGKKLAKAGKKLIRVRAKKAGSDLLQRQQ
jgi:hypothetical protein